MPFRTFEKRLGFTFESDWEKSFVVNDLAVLVWGKWRGGRSVSCAENATDLPTTASRVRISFNPLLPTFAPLALPPPACPLVHYVTRLLLVLALGNLRLSVTHGHIRDHM
eukprot:Gb_14939 [translate_table: standard]